MYVTPRPGGPKVRRPEAPYAHVPDEGAEVPEESYWLRRVADGDLLLGRLPPAVIVPAPPASSTEEKTR